jgi:hypothetical protein
MSLPRACPKQWAKVTCLTGLTKKLAGDKHSSLFSPEQQ